MTKNAADVILIIIDLHINEKPSLFILLGADGSINRRGRGTLNTTEIDLYMGKTDPAIFMAVRDRLTADMLEFKGETLQHPTPLKGAPCKLEVVFQFKDGTAGGFTFLYGSESLGPPGNVVELVKAAVRETGPWYEDFLRVARKNESKPTGIWVTLKRWLRWLRDDLTGRNRP